MDLKIGQVAKLLNMPAETIRFYEKEHVIDPRRIPDSKYRMYSEQDIFDLLSCLKYRNMDFSLKDSVSLMKEADLETMRDMLHQKFADKRKSIEYQYTLTDYIRDYEGKIASAPYNVGNLWVRPESEIYCVFNAKNGRSIYSDEENKTLQSWLGGSPFYQLCSRYRFSGNASFSSQGELGLMMEKQYYEYLNMPQGKDVTIYPAGLSLHTVIRIDEKEDLVGKNLRPLLDFIGGNHFQITGDLLAEVLVRIHEESGWFRYLDVRIPIRKK